MKITNYGNQSDHFLMNIICWLLWVFGNLVTKRLRKWGDLLLWTIQVTAWFTTSKKFDMHLVKFWMYTAWLLSIPIKSTCRVSFRYSVEFCMIVTVFHFKHKSPSAPIRTPVFLLTLNVYVCISQSSLQRQSFYSMELSLSFILQPLLLELTP